MTIDDVAVAPHKLRWLWLIGAALGVFTVGVSGTALGPALPTIARDLAVPVTQLRWITAGPELTFAVLVVPAAFLGRLLGPARLYLFGAIVLVLAGGLGATAGSSAVLELARLGQGVGAAFLVPQMMVYAVTYLPPLERVLVAGLFATAFVGGSGVGPLVGSTLVEHTSWHAVWWIVVALTVVAGLAGTPMVAQRLPIRFDLRALIVAVVAVPAVFAIMWPLVGRDPNDWPVWSVVLILFGLVLFVAVAIVDAIRLGGRTGGVAPLLAFFAFYGSTHVVLLPVYLQVVAGHSAKTVSYLGVASAVGALFGAAVAVIVGLFFDQRIAAAVGVVSIGAGVLLSLVTLGSLRLVTAGTDEALTGFGLGLVVTVLAGQADAVMMFPALTIGTAFGTTLALAEAGNIGAGNPAGVLRHAAMHILMRSLGPLAVALVVAAGLPGRTGRAGAPADPVRTVPAAHFGG